MEKKSISKALSIVLAFLFLFNAFFSGLDLTAHAQEQDGSKENKKAIIDALDNEPEFKEVDTTVDYIYNDSNVSKYDPRSVNRNIDYVVYRIFRSDYIYDVKNYSAAHTDSNYDSREIAEGGVACDSNRDGSLLYHNCDIPTFITSLQQTVYSVISKHGVLNAGRTTAYDKSMLGVPMGIEEGEVPLDLSTSGKKYTGLEAFGYDLELTHYTGEWDQISVNTEARLLSNFGIFDKIALGGKTIFNAATEFFSGFINNFSWNPIKWIGRSLSDAIGGGVITIMDTSDANVVATRAWNRSLFAGSVYNAHYLSSKMVVERADKHYQKFVKDEFENYANRHKELQPWFDLLPENIPELVRDRYPEFSNQEAYEKSQQEVAIWEKEEATYRRALAAYERCLAEGGDCGVRPLSPGAKPHVVEGIPLTEKEIYDYYRKDPETLAFFEHANKEKNIGAQSIGDADIQNIDELYAKYKVEFESRIKNDMNDSGKIMQEIFKEMHDDFFGQNPHYDTKKEISHWVCVKSDGSDKITTEDILQAPYLFLDEYSGEINTAECGNIQVRPSIKGGLSGSGDIKSTDTRWQVFSRNIFSGRALVGFNAENAVNSSSTLFSKTLVKYTNEILNISFGNILEELGLIGIMVSLIEALRDGFYFPLSIMAIAITALWILFSLMKNGAGGIAVIKAIIGIVIVFFACVLLMADPQFTLESVEKVPLVLEELITNTLYNEDSSGNNLCSIDAEGEHQIRSIQCEIWQIGILTPWVAQQFGTTDWQDLNVNNMKNTNGTLVGDAKVSLGGSSTMNNWAIYQLHLTKAGNISQDDPERNDGGTDRRIYQLVDLQFGPNNAAASDTRFADSWSGESRDSSPALLAGIFSIVMFLSIARFSLYKIQITLAMSLNIMLLPFVSFLALLPNGTPKFKEYLSNMVGLIIKRVASLIFLIVVMKFLVAGSSLGFSILTYYIYGIIVFAGLNFFWTDFLKLVDTAGSSAKSGLSGLMSGNTLTASEIKDGILNSKAMPKSLKQYARTKKRQTDAIIGGTVAGSVLAIENQLKRKDDRIKFVGADGNLQDAGFLGVLKKTVSESMDNNENMAFRQNRREGFGMFQALKYPVDAVNQQAVNNLTKGGRTVESQVFASGFSKLQSMGIRFSEDDLMKDYKLQRMIREYARSNEELNLTLLKMNHGQESDEVLAKRATKTLTHLMNMETVLRNKSKELRDAHEKEMNGGISLPGKGFLRKRLDANTSKYVFEGAQTLAAREALEKEVARNMVAMARLFNLESRYNDEIINIQRNSFYEAYPEFNGLSEEEFQEAIDLKLSELKSQKENDDLIIEKDADILRIANTKEENQTITDNLIKEEISKIMNSNGEIQVEQTVPKYKPIGKKSDLEEIITGSVNTNPAKKLAVSKSISKAAGVLIDKNNNPISSINNASSLEARLEGGGNILSSVGVRNKVIERVQAKFSNPNALYGNQLDGLVKNPLDSMKNPLESMRNPLDNAITNPLEAMRSNPFDTLGNNPANSRIKTVGGKKIPLDNSKNTSLPIEDKVEKLKKAVLAKTVSSHARKYAESFDNNPNLQVAYRPYYTTEMTEDEIKGLQENKKLIGTKLDSKLPLSETNGKGDRGERHVKESKNIEETLRTMMNTSFANNPNTSKENKNSELDSKLKNKKITASDIKENLEKEKIRKIMLERNGFISKDLEEGEIIQSKLGKDLNTSNVFSAMLMRNSDFPESLTLLKQSSISDIEKELEDKGLVGKDKKVKTGSGFVSIIRDGADDDFVREQMIQSQERRRKLAEKRKYQEEREKAKEQERSSQESQQESQSDYWQEQENRQDSKKKSSQETRQEDYRQRETSDSRQHKQKDSAQDYEREPVRESGQEPIKEPDREPVRESKQEPVREADRESTDTSNKEPVRNPDERAKEDSSYRNEQEKEKDTSRNQGKNKESDRKKESADNVAKDKYTRAEEIKLDAKRTLDNLREETQTKKTNIQTTDQKIREEDSSYLEKMRKWDKALKNNFELPNVNNVTEKKTPRDIFQGYRRNGKIGNRRKNEKN